jgi:hypothetical protein
MLPILLFIMPHTRLVYSLRRTCCAYNWFHCWIHLLWIFRKNHPLVNTLSHHGNPWIDVAARINIEFRRIDKFSSHIGGTSVYITDSWIIKCSAYRVDIAHKPDVHLNILKAENHEISIETNSAVQFLNIQISSINSVVKPFVIRLNSLDYSELKEKIHAPIVNARNVVIHQSLSDQFVKAFKEQVEQNQRFHIDRNTEVCFLLYNPICWHMFCSGKLLTTLIYALSTY